MCPFDLQRPLVILFVVSGLKPLITGVRVASYCEDVNVTMANPRNCFVPQASDTTTQISRFSWFGDSGEKKWTFCYRQMAHLRFEHITAVRIYKRRKLENYPGYRFVSVTYLQVLSRFSAFGHQNTVHWLLLLVSFHSRSYHLPESHNLSLLTWLLLFSLFESTLLWYSEMWLPLDSCLRFSRPLSFGTHHSLCLYGNRNLN